MITPAYINELVDFYPHPPAEGWSFDPQGYDMRSQQVKGAAQLFNLLEREKIALLADEVGMGKTIQALSVMAALWRHKPEARVLIFAPRDEIARNWQREYENFIRQHYRHHDNIVKTVIGSDAANPMVYCYNLYDLVDEIKQGWAKCFIGKISSFSNLQSRQNVKEMLQALGIRESNHLRSAERSKERYTREIASLLREEVNAQTPKRKPFFDLLIIDEAHYFRHKNGNSLRVNTASAFFGDPSGKDTPLAERVLLLTATPNHTSSDDIRNIISYFSTRLAAKTHEQILDALCVRRLRRLSSHALNKYNYRNELEAPSDFEHNPRGEMFFGIYQHELARLINKTKGGGNSGGGITRIMRYLEGVEFIPFDSTRESDREDLTDDDSDEKEGNSTSVDFSTGEDAHILRDISGKYQAIFKENPRHPKYDRLVEDLTVRKEASRSENTGEPYTSDGKALVFVRRIASVYEIAKRVLDWYDQQMWNEMLKDPRYSGTEWYNVSRRTFKKASSDAEADIHSVTDQDLADQVLDAEQSNIPSSRVLDLFKTMKNDSIRSTDASNFRNAFRASKGNVFSLFFSPAADYAEAPYREFSLLRFEETKRETKEHYYYSALLQRVSTLADPAVAKDIQSRVLNKTPLGLSQQLSGKPLSTLLTIYWEVLEQSTLTRKAIAEIRSAYARLSPYQHEGLASFIEKGTLLASEGVVWLYIAYGEAGAGNQGEPLKRYQRFTELVRERLVHTRLFNQISDCILHFRNIHTKVFGIGQEIRLLDHEWDNFNNAQPIYPYNADNKNQQVILSFNTPFFPDILVATSVLQEGVNLQYFCKTIYHYGTAWTPGDNEQRIGRIDRMFGLIERDLNNNVASSLPIYYPYLKDTVDQEHLSRFIKRKTQAEELIDKGKVMPDLDRYALEENQNDDWTGHLRKPSRGFKPDPYPVDMKSFRGILKTTIDHPIDYLEQFSASIIHAIRELDEIKPEVYVVQQKENYKIIVDPQLSNDRRQPVIIEYVYDPIGSGYRQEPVYCLRMKTPLAQATYWKLVRKRFYENQDIMKEYGPGIKMCLDITGQSSSTHWGLYMSCELPLFYMQLRENPLSIHELEHALVHLIHCADMTEQILMDKQDIELSDLNMEYSRPDRNGRHLLRKTGRSQNTTRWHREGEYLILEEAIRNKTNEPERESWSLNHKHLYVKFIPTKGGMTAQTAYLATDAQKEELQILEKHLHVVTGELF